MQRGLVKHIGICNMGCSLIRDLLSYCSVRPEVLQIERHPFLVQEKLVRFCGDEGIVVTGFRRWERSRTTRWGWPSRTSRWSIMKS